MRPAERIETYHVLPNCAHNLVSFCPSSLGREEREMSCCCCCRVGNVAYLVILQTILDHVFESKVLVTTIQPGRSFIALHHALEGRQGGPRCCSMFLFRRRGGLVVLFERRQSKQLESHFTNESPQRRSEGRPEGSFWTYHKFPILPEGHPVLMAARCRTAVASMA